jgi:23S rRNA pseudouridine2457 synthase
MRRTGPRCYSAFIVRLGSIGPVNLLRSLWKRQFSMRGTVSHPSRYIALFKPCDVLCQFSDAAGRSTLKEFVPIEGIYPVGRLDRDSEGLLLLTDDGRLAHRLTDPRFEHPKTYLVQVDRVPEPAAIESLRRGVFLNDGRTRPAQVEMLAEPPAFPDRSVPIRFRKAVPTAWLRLTIREGRNRQVRRMTAAVGHPTLRLVRVAIGPVSLGTLVPGQWRELNAEELNALRAIREAVDGRGNADPAHRFSL